jgi:hypothetical protein
MLFVISSAAAFLSFSGSCRASLTISSFVIVLLSLTLLPREVLLTKRWAVLMISSCGKPFGQGIQNHRNAVPRFLNAGFIARDM